MIPAAPFPRATIALVSIEDHSNTVGSPAVAHDDDDFSLHIEVRIIVVSVPSLSSPRFVSGKMRGGRDDRIGRDGEGKILYARAYEISFVTRIRKTVPLAASISKGRENAGNKPVSRAA